MYSKSLKTTSLIILTSLTLSACSWLKQPAAPVEESRPTALPSGSVGQTTEPSTTGQNTGAVSTTPKGPYIPSTAAVDPNASMHIVAAGDTLYNIAKRYGVKQDDIIAWNNMPDITVKLGQSLHVKSPTGATTSTTVAGTSPTVVKQPPAVKDDTPTGTGNVNWGRPTTGAVITQYTEANKGVDIAGTKGQAIVAAADGKVVYSGNKLSGYGNLLIIQHNKTFLSAYAHNQTLLVKEGDNVKKGQKIAEMGNSDADRVKLHFEIRQLGKPVNPTKFITF